MHNAVMLLLCGEACYCMAQGLSAYARREYAPLLANGVHGIVSKPPYVQSHALIQGTVSLGLVREEKVPRHWPFEAHSLKHHRRLMARYILTPCRYLFPRKVRGTFRQMAILARR